MARLAPWRCGGVQSISSRFICDRFPTAMTRSRRRLASNIPHDTLFAPRGVSGRKTSTYLMKVLVAPEHEKGIRHGTQIVNEFGDRRSHCRGHAGNSRGDGFETGRPLCLVVWRCRTYSGAGCRCLRGRGLQIQMVRRISQIYDVEFTENRGKALIASLAGAMIPATSGIGAASVLKSVPIIGTIAGGFVMPALSAGATYAIGKAFIQHFATGGTLLNFNPPDYREFIKRQRDMWDSRKNRAAKSSPDAGATTNP